MPTEKYDKQLRENIEALNAVPTAFSFNPVSSWQQLENRLQVKPAKKTAWLYWAVACLFIILSSMFVLLQEKKQGVTVSTKEQPEKIKTAASIVQQQPTAQKQVTSKQGMPINKQQPTVINTNRIAAPTTVNNEPVVTVATASNNPSTETKNLPTAVVEYKAENTMVIDNKNPVQQPVAPKKTRMKIVHLNEMGQEQQQPVALTNAASKKAIHQQDEMDVQVPEPNKSWWLFKTKPAITNTSKTINR